MKSISVFLVALSVATPLAAQSIIPRERPATAEEEGTVRGDLARKTMDQFALCVLDRRRKLVLEALAMPPGSPEQNEAFRYLSKTECIASATMHFNGPAFRASLYTALVRKTFGRKEVFPVPASGEVTPEAEMLSSLGEGWRLKFASCVIHRDPTNARTAILATAGSPAEDDAMAELAKVDGQCVYKDNTLRLSKAGLLGLLAEAYYRDASALAEKNSAAK
jgi:hypothetical protein